MALGGIIDKACKYNILHVQTCLFNRLMYSTERFDFQKITLV